MNMINSIKICENLRHLRSKFLLFFLGITFGATALVAQIAEGGTPASFAFQDDVQLRSAKIPFIAPIDFDVTQLMEEDKMAEDAGVLPRTSVIIPANLTMENAGEWLVLPDGVKIWRLTVQAPEAIAIMLYYDRFFIPDGGKLFIYNANLTHLLGAYTSNTNPNAQKFATEFAAGDEIILEYNEPPSPGARKPDIRISGIGYGYNYLEVYQPQGVADRIGNIFNQNCQVNINCPEGNNWQDHKKGVAKSVAPAGNSGYMCSGTVINNTAQDLTPYYLSAHHCFDDSAISFDQIVFYFHYESEGCETTTPANSRTIVGAQMLVDLPINGSSDGALLKLNSNIPLDYGVYYNGWDRRNTPATSGVGIHHPKGDIKKISTFTATASSSQWSSSDKGAADAHWQVSFAKTQSGYSQTEGGSSGSPLFNQAGLVVGTLTGGTASNCTRGSNNWYGKLWYHWNNANAVVGSTQTMKDYLDPLNTGAETLNGIYNAATGNTDLLQLTVNPGELVPAFSSFRTGYTVHVPESVEVITVSATAATAGATVTGTGNHRLAMGTNTIRVTVTAPDRSASKAYTLTVNRSQQIPPDRYEPNNTLAQAYSLPVSFSNDTALVQTTGSTFHNETDIDYYRIDLPAGNHYTVFAWLLDLHNNDDNRTYTVDAKFAYSTNGQDWSDEFDDVMPGNVVITNGGTVYFRAVPYFEGETGDYLLEINIERRQAGNSNNANLSDLSIDPGNLYFLPNWLPFYSVYVAHSVSGITIDATPADANAVVSGVGYHHIQVGTNTIPVVVTAQNGTTRKTYTITVLRRTTANNNANLLNLTVNQGTLTPRFTVNVTDYNVTVANTVTDIHVSATAVDSYASVMGAGDHQLVVGNNAIHIDVIAENGSTIKTYRINVTREIVSGMEDFHQPQVVAYPNPASARIMISGLSGNGIISLFDAVGK